MGLSKEKSSKAKYDAILVALGGLNAEGRPHEWVIRRLKQAFDLYTGHELIILLGHGTVNKPPVVDRRGFVVSESLASARILKRWGVRPEHLFLENFSLDTIGNGAFARIIFTDPLKLTKLAVVTSEHHMPRLRSVFDWIYSLKPLFRLAQLDFFSVSDSGLDEHLIYLRSQKEKKSLLRLKKDKKGITTLFQLQSWLFTRHGAYAFAAKPDRLSGKILKTY